MNAFIRIGVGVALALAAATPSSSATLSHDYQLNGSLADSLGGASLATIGTPTQTATGVNFFSGNGLQLAGSAFSSADSYSILMTFQVDSTDGPFGYGGVFAPRAGVNGLYAFGPGTSKALVYYYAGNQGSTALTFGVSHDVAFVRDANGAASIYIDGVSTAVPYAEAIDTSGFARFFNQASENAAGFADRIRIYDGAMSAAEITAAFAVPAVPEPRSWAMMALGLGVIGALLRRRPSVLATFPR